MQKIIEKLYVGPVRYIKFIDSTKFSVLGVCKEPLHRMYAKLDSSDKEGYITRSIPMSEKEYYFAERDHALYCNLIDADDMKYIPDIIIERAMKFIADEIADGKNVLVVCNNGVSRSPSIALMYLIKEGYFPYYAKFEDVVRHFKSKYPLYSPNKGFYDYTEKFFNERR